MGKGTAWLHKRRELVRPAPSFGSRYPTPTALAPLISWSGCAAPSAYGTPSASYQRTTTAGVVTLTAVAPNNPRFEKILDAAGREFVGSLVEAAVDNQCVYSEELDQGAAGTPTWYRSNLASISANSAAGPDGSTVLDGLVGDGTNGVHGVAQWCSASGRSVFSAFARAGDKGWAYLVNASLANGGAWFNISTPAVGIVGAGVVGAGIQNWGGGLVRCWIITDSTGYNRFDVYAAASDGVSDFAGDSAAVNIHAGCCMVHAGTHPASYVKTNSGGVVKAADVLTYAIVEGSDIGAGQGTVRFRFLAPSFTPAASHYLLSLSDGGAAADMIGVYLDTSGYLNVESAASGGNAGACQIATNFCDNYIHEVMLSWQKDRMVLWCDGVPSAVDTSVDIPNDLDTLHVGNDEAGANAAGPALVADWKLFPRYLSSWSRRGSGWVA